MHFKVLLVVIAAIVATALASHDKYGGYSDSYRKQDDHGNYNFGYDITDGKGAKNWRKESGDHSGKWGSYGLKDVDGRWRRVEYVADKSGFRAKIDTNEPGTGNVDAADAIINGADPHGGSKTNIATGHHAPNYNDGHKDGHYNDGHKDGHKDGHYDGGHKDGHYDGEHKN